MPLLKPKYSRLHAGHPLAKGLIGAWAFNEGAGGLLHDLSGFSNHGTLTNGPLWMADRAGSAMQFNGSTQYVTIPAIVDNNEITCTAWMKSANLSGYRVIVAQHDGSATGGYICEVGRTANKVSMAWDNVVAVTGNQSLSTGVWYFVAWTRAGSAGNWTARIYINGGLDNTGTTVSDPNGTTQATTIGAFAGGGSYFSGYIDDVKIYRRALTPAEIMQLYIDSFRIYRPPPRKNYNLAAVASYLPYNPWPQAAPILAQ